MFHIFLMIVFWNLSLLLRQWDIMEKTRYMSKMVSYNHNGMKTMNQDHLTLLSNLRASKIRNIKHMNHVKSALCRTAIVFKCSFFVDYVSKSQRLTASQAVTYPLRQLYCILKIYSKTSQNPEDIFLKLWKKHITHYIKYILQ